MSEEDSLREKLLYTGNRRWQSRQVQPSQNLPKVHRPGRSQCKRCLPGPNSSALPPNTHAHTHTHTLSHTHTRTHTRTHTHVHTHTHTRTHTVTHAHTHAHTHMHTHTLTHVYTHTHMHTHTLPPNTHTRTHTHTHTHTELWAGQCGTPSGTRMSPESPPLVSLTRTTPCV